MNRSGIGSAIDRRDAAEDVFGVCLGVFDEHIEIPVAKKDVTQSIEQFEFTFGLRAAPIDLNEFVIRVSDLWILIKHHHVRMGRRAVEKKIVLFYILAVISLLIGQTEHPLFKDAILFIPQCHGQADMLLVIAKSTNAVFVPAIGSVAGMVMRKIVPCITVCAVVFVHGSP